MSIIVQVKAVDMQSDRQLGDIVTDVNQLHIGKLQI